MILPVSNCATVKGKRQLTNMSIPFSRSFHLYSIPDALNLLDLLGHVSALPWQYCSFRDLLAAVLYSAQVFERTLEARTFAADMHSAGGNLPRPRQSTP